MTVRELLLSISGVAATTVAFRDILGIIRDKPPVSTEGIELRSDEEQFVSAEKYGIIAKVEEVVDVIEPQTQQDQVVIKQEDDIIVQINSAVEEGVIDGLQKSC